MDKLTQHEDSLVMLYVPCGGEDEATALASRLLSEGFIACANIYTSRSLYRWKGEIADEGELVLICKTLASRSEEAVALVKELHSYEVPCILRIVPALSNEEFYRWVQAEVGGTDRSATATNALS